MDETILTRAKELFGETRFEEIMGELWLQREVLTTRAAGRRGLDTVLREWENRFRRDTEEGRVQNKAGHRRRILRLSELFPEETEPTWDAIQHQIKRKL
jgi:hypothetical protein